MLDSKTKNMFFVTLVVSLILSIYEIVLFYLVVAPSAKQSIEYLVNKFKTDVPIEIKGIVDTLEEREAKLAKSINTYTKISALILVLVLLLGVLYFYKNLGSEFSLCNWQIIAANIIPVLLFQYSFYKLGTKWNYIGSYGNEELISALIEKPAL